jgi:hypothetical protein
MIKLKCNSTTWRVDPKTGLETKYDDVEPYDIYEVDEKLAEELLATGNFEKV